MHIACCLFPSCICLCHGPGLGPCPHLHVMGPLKLPCPNGGPTAPPARPQRMPLHLGGGMGPGLVHGMRMGISKWNRQYKCPPLPLPHLTICSTFFMAWAPFHTRGGAYGVKWFLFGSNLTRRIDSLGSDGLGIPKKEKYTIWWSIYKQVYMLKYWELYALSCARA